MATSTMFLMMFFAAVILGSDSTISADFLRDITTNPSAARNAQLSLLTAATTVTTGNSTKEQQPEHLNTSTPTAMTSSTTMASLRTTMISAISENDNENSTGVTSSTSTTTKATITSEATPTLTHTLLSTSLTFPTSNGVALNSTSEMSPDAAAVAVPEAPSSDSLIKGFSIPTYLPSFRAFSAVLTQRESGSTQAAAASALSPHQLQKQHEQEYLDAYNKHHASRTNFTTLHTNVTVQMGSHAYLPCHIRRLKNKPVSWVRVRDGHILTVDQITFIADQRFQTIFRDENEYTWSLQIKYVQAVDEGLYECQVSTEPKMSAKIYLSVVVPKTELIGDQNRFVKAGSKVALHCIVRGTLEPPSYIIWFRGKTQISDDNKLGWYTQIDRNIFGNSSDQQNTIGSLIIPFVLKKDSGNYRCQPSNSAPVSVDLHVLSGEYSASAIMSAAPTLEKNNIYFLFFILVSAVLRKT